MKDFFKKFAYTSCFVFGVIFGLLMIPFGSISYEIFFGMPLQTLTSQKNHTATLRRKRSLLDYKLDVEVDGQLVYRTSVWGISEMQLRATLVWDETGRVVAFERMGQIIFAYDAEEERTMGLGELKDYCLSPMPDSYRLYIKNNCKDE